MTSKRWVALAGGLGNQLFQYAHSISGLNWDENSRLECVGFKIGNTNSFCPELLKFDLKRTNIVTNNWRNTKVEQLCFNYILRNSTYKNEMRKYDPLLKLCRILLLPRTIIKYFEHEKKIENYRMPNLEIGYFQDERFPKEVIDVMQGLSLKEKSAQVLAHSDLAKLEQPLIVHLRLGDYRLDPDLGCLSLDYYRAAISETFWQGNYLKIWLFSDDIEVAKRKIGESFAEHIRIIDPTLSAAETFEIMRLGNGYIIANSSFSFWAAMLCKNRNSNVIAPAPWFKREEISPNFLPGDWIIRQADFD